jgi:hypothetical protein
MLSSDFPMLRALYNAFDPFEPLPADDPAYVDCRAVRGDEEILTALGKEIALADRITHQLYTGHRGAGKSTELQRLVKFLQQNGFRVVYFAADEEDIDKEDAQYTDILLACTRHLLRTLKGGDNNPVWRWVQSRMQALQEILQSEITLEDISLEAQITQFAKLTATLKASPDTRAKIRQAVEPHTVSLTEALNQFITEGMAALPEKTPDKLVVIADNLDRIVPSRPDDHSRSNHELIFIDRSEQLRALACHVIYTVPISLVYSNRGTDLRDNYDTEPQVLPMVMVRSRDGGIYGPGLAKMKELLAKRVYNLEVVPKGWALDGQIFDSLETVDNLCLMSGGHLRNLMMLTQEAIKQTDTLPIPAMAVRRAITSARNTYRNTIYDSQWEILAAVARTKEIRNDTPHRDLLFNRCILEYRYLDKEGEIQCWRDVHPLIRGIKEFQAAL